MFARTVLRMNREQRSLGTELLHQQLYVIGRDIDSKHGNLMIEYGCHREQSPIPGIPSLYTITLSHQSRIALRGFGVFIGDDSIGGIFVQRYSFQPRWMPKSRFEPIAWLPKQMPNTRPSRQRSELRKADHLLVLMIDWFIDYEAWITEKLGGHFRIGQLTHFPNEKHRAIHWNLRHDWLELRETMLG